MSLPPALRVCLQTACLSAWHGLTPVLHQLRFIGNSLTYKLGFSIFQIGASSSPVLGRCLKHLQAPLPPHQEGDASFCSCYTVCPSVPFAFFRKPLDLFCLPALGCCSSFILKGKKQSNPYSSMGTLQSLVNKRVVGYLKREQGELPATPSAAWGAAGLAEVLGLVLASGFCF